MSCFSFKDKILKAEGKKLKSFKFFEKYLLILMS